MLFRKSPNSDYSLWMNDESKIAGAKTSICEGFEIDSLLIQFMISCTIGRSLYYLVNIMNTGSKNISILTKLFIAIEIFVTCNLNLISFRFLSSVSGTINLLTTLLGLLVINSVDKHVGMAFESHLQNWHEQTLNSPKYLKFETTQKRKIVSYIYSILSVALTMVISGFEFYNINYNVCPNFETIVQQVKSGEIEQL